jgi:hypothetical protein
MMDDFLHNLRTGKNKPFDRNRKQFDSNGYKNPDRQGTNDNRRKDAFQRPPSVDHFPAIKILLGDISEGQRRLADIYERRATAEERIASALERLASGFSGNNPPSQPAVSEQKIDEQVLLTVVETAEPVSALQPETTTILSRIEITDDSTQPELDRNRILEMIGDMRKEQMSYEKIARTLEAQGIPTFSGKGAWHSQTISKLCHQFHPSLS